MEVRTTEEAKSNALAAVKEIAGLLKQKKEIDDEIKIVKQKFKEDGVPVQVVAKIITSIKADKKKTAAEKFEFDTMKEWAETDADVDALISELL